MASAQDTQVVKIGHVAPMSGGQAHYGKDNENGVRMAIEELNTQNIVIGGKKIKFEIAAEDGDGFVVGARFGKWFKVFEEVAYAIDNVHAEGAAPPSRHIWTNSLWFQGAFY